ncbi:MAG: VOC family protein [Planctomycetota bacterium]
MNRDRVERITGLSEAAMSNPLCHFEFMTGDPKRCQAFYGEVFDWHFDDEAMPGYTIVRTGHDPSGGMFARPGSTQGACVNVYFTVPDIDATLSKVTQHGGKALVSKTAIPGLGHFAMFADPEGVAIGIMQPG